MPLVHSFTKTRRTIAQIAHMTEFRQEKGGVAKVARRLNAHPLYLFQNKRLLVNRLSVIDKHLSHL